MKRPASLIAVLAVGLLTLTLATVILQPQLSRGTLRVGSAAPATYQAPRTITYKSDIKTNEAEQAAAAAIAPIYRADVTAASQQGAKLQGTIDAIVAVRVSPENLATKTDRIRQILPNSTDGAAILATADEPTWQVIVMATRSAAGKLQATQLRSDQLNQIGELARAQLPAATPDAQQEPAADIVAAAAVPNYVINEEATNATRQQAKDAVEPVQYTIEKDQVAAYRGQALTAFDIERLTALGLAKPAVDWMRALGLTALLSIFSVLLWQAVRTALPVASPRQSWRLQLLVAAAAVGVTIAGVLVAPSQPTFGYLVPVAAVPLVIRVFYDRRAAVLTAVPISALFAIAAGNVFDLLIVQLAASVAAAISGGRHSRIRDFGLTGLRVAALVAIGLMATTLISGDFAWAAVPKYLFAAVVNGGLTAALGFGATALLSAPLGVVTFLQLLELENPRQPLLRKLAHEAPGTYSHSLRMAGLVENVAERIGADPLLARVQTLYHDIGKTAMSEYFIENQRGTDAHADLSPKESAEILRAHISEGLQLAKQHGLPDQVAAAIPEHHGTSRMEFFWNTAKQTFKRPNERDYRYYGPKPQSKETAIIMLADAVEAASRTLEDPDERSIRRLINKLVSARIEDGQLDDAPLTTKELTTLREAFSTAILADMHKRIKYPERRDGTARS